MVGLPIVVAILSRQITAGLFFFGVHVAASYEWVRLVDPSAMTNGAASLSTVVSVVFCV